ncbi:MrcB family domain-containing protein [Streptomyces cucumeris]|uniref:MrcB family domain-containing protein n=1 Tax=Streptomyces cucumeris TaxID=2962890 RepID=UPI003D73C3EE
MGICDLLLDVASTYDQGQGTATGVHAQDRLRATGNEWADLLPGGFEAEGNGGSGGASQTPWIGVYDPAVTRDPKKGLYLAYIFAADLSTVSLTLQQGVTSLKNTLGEGEKRRSYLRSRAETLRTGLPPSLLAGWEEQPLFRCKLSRALSYEAGSVAARTYNTADMPTESSLRRDLWHLAELLQHAASAERLLKDEETTNGLRTTGFVSDPPTGFTGLDGFRPKDGRDYVAHIAQRTVTVTRDHENLIDGFGRYIEPRGFVPITEKMHPKDLVLRRGGVEWLVEAKTVKKGNPTKAVREALSQLFEYRHFLYVQQGQPKPHLLGLFTEDIEVYAPYLEERGIASVWKTVDGWAGSPRAVEWGMVDMQ